MAASDSFAGRPHKPKLMITKNYFLPNKRVFDVKINFVYLKYIMCYNNIVRYYKKIITVMIVLKLLFRRGRCTI